MDSGKLLQSHLEKYCEKLHNARLLEVMEVASGLQKSQNLSLSSIGRNLPSDIKLKNKIKKVDRLESNSHLHKELETLYEGMSAYVFKYIAIEASTPIIIDVCYLKDNRAIQMLSAEIALKGRSLPLYRDVFSSGELKGRAKAFLSHLKNCVPSEREVIIIMDAGFSEDWFKEIEELNWKWLVRVRQGKQIKLSKDSAWLEMKDFFKEIERKAKNYKEGNLMKRHERPCRIITKKQTEKASKKGKKKKLSRDYNAGSGSYRRSAQEPWVLATNLGEDYTTTQVLNLYKKRMQIEESFRDIKSHQFGLGGRYIRTECVHR